MKRVLISFVLGLLLLPAGVWAQDDPGADASGQANLEPIVWEPMIVEFFADSSHGSSAIVAPPKKDPPRANDVYGEAAQWLALKPLIPPRKEAYPAGDNVLSAWQRIVKDDGTVEFVHYGSAGSNDPAARSQIHAIFAKDAVVRLFFDLDILMNRSPDQKDQIVKDHFKLAELTLTAVKISDDPANFRDAPPANAKEFTIIRVGGPNEAIGEDFRTIMGAWTRPKGSTSWDTRLAGAEKGVYEFRVKARVLGRANSQEEYVSKTIEGAIRIAMVDDTTLEVRKLSGSSMRKTGEKDIIKNGLPVGTTQDPAKPKNP